MGNILGAYKYQLPFLDYADICTYPIRGLVSVELGFNGDAGAAGNLLTFSL